MAPPRKKQRASACAQTAFRSTTATAVATRPPPTRRTNKAVTREADTATTSDEVSTRASSRVSPVTKTVKRVMRKGRLEIQLMIYEELDPRDLHHLSRTCKKFRLFFLNRQRTEKLWERTRRNVDLPDRPTFMSEPAFIHLLYTKNCHYCGAQGVHKILHGYFIRLCSLCFKEK
ncbi:hypothetical protein BC628DRAFT_1200810 [Trametes gibbosa]|nr:hypothetical protein BC628DRAFT_1200810 [Trametes gibbosa]